MFSASQIIKSPATLRPVIVAYVGRELFHNKDVFEAREAAIEILGQFTTLACGIPGACAPSESAAKLRVDAERAIIGVFAQAGLRFDPKTHKTTKLVKR